MMYFAQWQEQAQSLLQLALGWLKSPQFYAQVAAIITVWLAIRIAARTIISQLWLFNSEPVDGRLGGLHCTHRYCFLLRPKNLHPGH